MDSGFDNGQFSYDLIHPDFKFATVDGQHITVIDGHRTLWSFQDDRDHHGTLVTSIIAGFPSISSGRTENPQNYRFGLGLAPTVRCVVDQVFFCSHAADTFSLDSELTTLAGPQYNTNVINMSVNDPVDVDPSKDRCSYTANPQAVGNRTRSHNLLAVVAAGNSPEGCAGNYAASPGTAKNAVTVGSTDNYTIQWTNPDNPITTNTCAWNGFLPPASQDATRVPNYSAVRRPGNVIKPDLVAPSTRVTGPLARGAPGCASPLCNANVASFTSPDAVTYGMSAGTSFAAPVVSGAAAVVRKWYKNLLGGNPSPAMTKRFLSTALGTSPAP
jgi:subtilisin family serine protease